MERRDGILLRKVLAEIDIAADMMGRCSLAEFERDERLKRAICMTVINIGELVKHVSDGCKTANPAIPWRAVAGFRDIAAHKYQTLRMEDVYETVTVDFPNLRDQINQLL